jgi:hypothetical protein
MRGDLLKRKVVIIGLNNGNCDDFIPCVLWKNDEFCFQKITENKNCHFPMCVMVFTGLQ